MSIPSITATTNVTTTPSLSVITSTPARQQLTSLPQDGSYCQAQLHSDFTAGNHYLWASPCCGGCVITASTAQVIYWPTPAAQSNITSIVDANGFTFQYPSIYVILQTLNAYDSCSNIGSAIEATTLSFSENGLSTLVFPSYNPIVGNSYVPPTHQEPSGLPYNFSSIDSTCATSLTSASNWILDGNFNPNPCLPFLLLSSSLTGLPSSWASCTISDFEVFDPPHAITPVSVLAGFTQPPTQDQTTSPSARQSASPFPSPTRTIAPSPSQTPGIASHDPAFVSASLESIPILATTDQSFPTIINKPTSSAAVDSGTSSGAGLQTLSSFAADTTSISPTIWTPSETDGSGTTTLPISSVPSPSSISPGGELSYTVSTVDSTDTVPGKNSQGANSMSSLTTSSPTNGLGALILSGLGNIGPGMGSVTEPDGTSISTVGSGILVTPFVGRARTTRGKGRLLTTFLVVVVPWMIRTLF